MYVTSYRSLTTEEKATYAIFQDLMNVFDISLYMIANDPTPPMMTDAKWDQILTRFSRYFSNKFPRFDCISLVVLPCTDNKISSTFEDCLIIANNSIPSILI